MRRRDFLRPFLHLLDDATSPAPDALLLRYGRRAMATTFEVILPFGSPPEAAQEALDLIDALEDQLTVYREHSEVSQVNLHAAAHPVRVEEHLFDLLYLCRQLWEETNAAFDVAVGALIKAWGFFRRQGRIPSEEELESIRGRVGSQHLLLDTGERTVFFAAPAVEINLGSIGKGYALDRVIQHLWQHWQIRSALVHGGHSSIFALGNEPGSRRGWQVSLADPRTPEKKLGLLHLRHRGLGTSAATHQFLEHEGRKLGHILDPRTARPARGMISASVTAPSAAVADALATAFFILGVGFARAYCEQHPEVGAVLLPETSSVPLILGQARQEFTP